MRGRSLDSLYTSILQEAFGDDKPEDDAKTRSVLGAVILTMNPLSPSAIATLLGFDAEDVPLLLSSVNSLLILQEDPISLSDHSISHSLTLSPIQPGAPTRGSTSPLQITTYNF
jgi:hypothetical protein